MTATSTIADVAAFIARCFGVDIGEMGRDATQLIISVLRMANVMIEIDYGMQGGDDREGVQRLRSSRGESS